MINIPEAYKDFYNSYGGKSIQLVFYKKEYGNLTPSNTLRPGYSLFPSQISYDAVDFYISDDMIHADSLTLSESLCASSEDLDFGACESAKLEIVVSGNNYIQGLRPRNGLCPAADLMPASSIKGKEFALIETLYPNGDFSSEEKMDFFRGIYIVDSVLKEDDRNTRRIVAYDRMSKFNVDVSDWYNALGYPITLRTFRKALCSYVGVPDVETSLVNDNMSVEKTLEADVLNGHDLIRYICQINGVFGNINHNGVFQYVRIPKKDNITDTITRYKTSESEDYVVPDIDTVQIRQEDGDVGGLSDGDKENIYIIEGNILAYGKTTSQLKSIANNVLSVISNVGYRPAVIEASAAPWYEMGDRIKVETSDGDVNTIIMARTSSGIQGPTDTISSTGSQELSQPFTVESQILQTKGLIAKLKFTVEEVSSELTDFEKSTTSKLTQTAEAITAEVTRATAEEGKLSSKITQTAEAITAEVTRATAEEGKLSSKITQTAEAIVSEVTRATNAEGQLSTRISQTEKDITLKVSKGSVSSELSLESGQVTLSSNRLIINSTNFKLDKDGNATFSGQITGGTININNVFKVDSSGSTSITGNKFSWNSDNSSLSNNGYLTVSGGRIAGYIIDGNDLRAVDSNSEILGGNIQTPNLMVETGSDKLFNADTYAGEINVYGDMYMNNNATIYELRVDTDEWSMSPYRNNVGYILDAIWTGHDWSLESLDERISYLESMI